MTTQNHAAPAPALDLDGRTAAERLGARGATAEWERRAEWLETEAKAQRDPGARARLLLAASEVRAMLGARADARRLAIQAAHHQPAPAFAARQARALHQTHGDVSAVVRGLAEESRAAPSAATRAHALYVAAEIQRLVQRDPAAAIESLEAQRSADPSDQRAPLARLLLELSQVQAPPNPAALPETGALARAAASISRLRGGSDPVDDPAHSGALCLADVQRALRGGRLDEAASALAVLEGRPGLLPAARWLRALWSAGASEGREAALAAYRELARDVPGRPSRRALAAHALRAGSWEGLQQAFDESSGGAPPAPSAPSSRPARPSFSSIERTALTALVGQTPGAELLDALEAPAAESIVSAVERASSRPPPGSARAATSDAAAEFALGRAAAAVARLSDVFIDPDSTEPSALVLRLEQSRQQRSWAGLARDLPRLLEHASGGAEGCFVAAVFAECGSDGAGARELFQASLPSSTTREAAARAMSQNTPDGAAAFRALSAHTSDPLRRALLLTEALFRLEPSAPEFDALAEEAVRTCPELALALSLGEGAARARGDRARVARWLGRAREHAQGSDEQALSAVREALFWLMFDRKGGVERLQALCDRHPNHLALLLACERWLEQPPRQRAEFRRRAAGLLSARGRQHFLAHAVSGYEAAGDASSAREAALELGGALGELWAARLATRDDELDALASEWSRQAQRTVDPELAAELYGRLARLAARRGQDELALRWQRERLALVPGSIDALRALELDSMEAGREAALEQSASALFEALGDPDGLGYAFVATRLKIARGAFEEARPLVRRAHATRVPPLWALRQGAVYARDAEDDRALLATCRSLRDRSSQALDAAILSLHAAEAGLRLGETGLARDDIQRAGELAPDDIVILSLRAELLLASGDFADAAEAFETLASATSSKTRQVDALYQAGLLWLDRLGHRARGALALQEAATLDVPHPGLLERLIALHAQSDDFDGLAELIERQRACAVRPAREADTELSRALDELDAGRLVDARGILDALLARQPGDVAVLQASAELNVRLGAALPAERDFRRVLEVGASGRIRLAALFGLAALYEGELERPHELADVYAQILSQDPDNSAIRRRLVVALANRKAFAEAATHQRELVSRAPDDESRRSALLYLIKLLDGDRGAAAEAESLIDQARRTWPDDPRVLEADVSHYLSLGDAPTARRVIERAMNAARDAVAVGRIDAVPFRTLEVAARLCDQPDTARVTAATAAAVAGSPRSELPGAGVRAGDPALDELIAPPPLSADFRALLDAAGAALERAYASDGPLETRVASEELGASVRRLSEGFGVEVGRVLVSPALGFTCECHGDTRKTLVLGQSLADHEDVRSRQFVVLGSLQLARCNASTLSRLSEPELWAVLAGFFACFAPAWPASGPDAQRLVLARNRIRPHVTWVPEVDLTARVAAMADELLPQVATVSEALRCWATRVALLGVGDPRAALDALWWKAHPGALPPRTEEARIQWIASQLEARDLVSFGVSDAYIEARRRLGQTP